MVKFSNWIHFTYLPSQLRVLPVYIIASNLLMCDRPDSCIALIRFSQVTWASRKSHWLYSSTSVQSLGSSSLATPKRLILLSHVRLWWPRLTCPSTHQPELDLGTKNSRIFQLTWPSMPALPCLPSIPALPCLPSLPADRIALVTGYCWLFSWMEPCCLMVEGTSVVLEKEFDAINDVLFPEAGQDCLLR